MSIRNLFKKKEICNENIKELDRIVDCIDFFSNDYGIMSILIKDKKDWESISNVIKTSLNDSSPIFISFCNYLKDESKLGFSPIKFPAIMNLYLGKYDINPKLILNFLYINDLSSFSKDLNKNLMNSEFSKEKTFTYKFFINNEFIRYGEEEDLIDFKAEKLLNQSDDYYIIDNRGEKFIINKDGKLIK